jgi:hypothetical protein
MKEKIKVSVTNLKINKESKRKFFDLTVFEFYDPTEKLIIMRRFIGVTLDRKHNQWIGNKIDDPLKSYLLTFFNTKKLPL